MGLIIAALIALGIVAVWPILRRHRDMTSRRIPYSSLNQHRVTPDFRIH